MEAIGCPCDLTARLIIVAAMNRTVLAFTDAVIILVKPLIMAYVNVINLVGSIKLVIFIFTREEPVTFLIICPLLRRSVDRYVAL